MTFNEVDDLSQRIDLPALPAYLEAVRVRTRALVEALNEGKLDNVLDEARRRVVLFDESLSPRAGFVTSV